MVTPLAKWWGSRVADRRRTLGLTQRQLADLCQITQQTVSKIENGDITPTDHLKVVLAGKLGTGPGRLFQWPSQETLTEVAS